MDAETQKQIDSISTQLIALLVILGAVCASIYVTWGFRDLLINGENSKYNQENLDDIAENTALVYFIVAIYFFILSYDNYQNENTTANKSYFTAATLALSASGIRYFQLKNEPDSVEGVEDII